MYVHFKIHRWVLWWFYIGIVCGVVALVNILNRHLNRTQEEIVIAIGVMHWVLGGLACYFYDSVQIEKPTQEPSHHDERRAEQQGEWHAASDFLLPGGRQSLLPPEH
jgi:hypothetical protein